MDWRFDSRRRLGDIRHQLAGWYDELHSHGLYPLIPASGSTNHSLGCYHNPGILGNQADTGKIFRHAITYTLLTTIAAAAVGLVLYNIVSPGNLPTALVQSGMADVPQKLGETSYYDHILGVIPNNIIKPFAEGNVLSILILAAAAGIALARCHQAIRKKS